MRYHTIVILLILAAVFCSIPALAQEKYLGASPQITAYIAGTNEFSPGQDATITVDIQNSGTSRVFFTNQGTLLRPISRQRQNSSRQGFPGRERQST